MSDQNILNQIRAVKETLPRRQRNLCEFILSNPVESSVLTINELSRVSGVGTTTIIRTVKALGMERYNELKYALRNSIFDRSESSYLVYWNDSGNRESPEKILASAIDRCCSDLQSLRNREFLSAISIGAKMIADARRIYVLGSRMSIGTSTVMEHTLRYYGLDSLLLSSEADFVVDQITQMEDNDLLICFASSPVGRTTKEALEVSHSARHRTLVITGGLSSHLASLSDIVINTGVPNRPGTIPATMMTIELLSMETARLLESKGAQPPSRRISRIQQLCKDNNIKLLE